MWGKLVDYLVDPWTWLILAMVLFILEAIIPGLYLLWFGFAAVVVGAAAFLIPMSFTTQVVLFVAASIVSLLIGRRFAGYLTNSKGEPDLNERSRQYIGRTFEVAEPIAGGHGKIRVGDTVWQAEGPDAAAGAQVRVTGARGTVLIVEPAAR
jgi:hypothetical protein